MKTIDLQGIKPREANALIKKHAKSEEKIVVENPHSIHYLCAGLDVEKPVEITVNGDVGYYAASMVNNVSMASTAGRAGILRTT
jgi:glutamate synthase domain-containing protein 3